MAQSASSLQLFNLGSDDPKYCALSGCEETAVDLPCATCSTAPNPDFSGDRLQDVRYCSDAHRTQDVEGHKETCRDRRWLRDGSRIGEMHYEIFVAVREEMYEWVVLSQEEDNLVRKFTVKDCDKPASEQAFCGSDIDPESKVCALSLNACVYALQLGSPFLAYMTKDSQFRLAELHIKPKPSAIVEARFENGDRIAMEEYFHSLFCLSPTFLSSEPGIFDEGGMILDASAAQMGFFDEQVARSERYASSKTVPHSENRKLSFGYFLRMHQNCLGESDWEHPEHAYHLAKEATFRVVNSVLFIELERLGGAKKILALEYAEWEEAKTEVVGKVREVLKKLRRVHDYIDFVVVASEEEKRQEKEKVMEELDGQGHQEMMRMFEETASE